MYAFTTQKKKNSLPNPADRKRTPAKFTACKSQSEILVDLIVIKLVPRRLFMCTRFGQVFQHFVLYT